MSKEMTADEKATAVDIVQKLLLDNESDSLSIDSHYKTVTARLQTKQALRVEKEQLTDALEDLTGTKSISVDQVAAAHSSETPPKDDDDKNKEPVKT